MNVIKEQLYIRNTTKRGYIVLYILVFLLLIFSPKLYNHFFPSSDITVVIEKNQVKKNEETTQITDSIEINKVNKAELMQIGIDSTIAQRWIDFREAKEGYSSIQDVKSIYGLESELYKQLQPWLYIENKITKSNPKTAKSGNKHLKRRQKEKAVEWIEFNPNKVTKDELTELGLSSKTASIWMKYKNAIGGFDSIQQVKKIYGVDSTWFSTAREYISFPKRSMKNSPLDSVNTRKHKKVETALPKRININEATVEKWDSLPDIDKKVAERIVKFRHSLNGFKELNDLSKVYGIPDGFVNKYEDLLIIDKKPDIPTQFNINNASIDELKRHPEINHQKASLIVKYRNQHGEYSSINDLRRIRALSPSWIQTAHNFLTIEPDKEIASN